ncbi:uncharacterized protein LOC135837578 [Planococcus citri]|uniref:uncharacterized protein LOC135837578 n=1 Tax=Planococcus citri TaxID=170843 RepID=UPI0031F8A9D2
MEELFSMAKLNNVFIEGPTMDSLLTNLIDELSKKIDNTTIHGIAVLIDESDTPVVRDHHNSTLSKNILVIMDNFFCSLKRNAGSGRIKYTYVTGVGNFALFPTGSGPNHITDKSLQPKYSTAIGFTEDEIKQHFSDYISHMAHTRSQPENEVTEKNILEEMCEWYRGYFFSEDTSPKNAIFNPCSIKRYFLNGHPEHTWLMNGRATVLKDELQKHSLEEVLKTCYLTPKPISKITLQRSMSIDNIKLLPLFYYYGYYTIKEYEDGNYYLDFPNLEVKDAFYEEVDLAVEDREKEIMELKNSLEILDLDQFFTTLNSIFLHIPSTLYDPQCTEEAFLKAMQALLTGADILAESEYTYSTPDIVVQLKNRVIVFELNKVGENEGENKVMEEALNQGKKHVQVFLHKHKPVTLVGVCFKTADRTIGWKAIYYSESGEEIEQTTTSP